MDDLKSPNIYELKLYYKLDENKNPVSVKNIHEMEWEKRDILKTVLFNDDRKIFISTVFLGVDHRLELKGDPLLFETMIFGIENDEYQERCSTYKEALIQHAEAVQHLVEILTI